MQLKQRQSEKKFTEMPPREMTGSIVAKKRTAEHFYITLIHSGQNTNEPKRRRDV